MVSHKGVWIIAIFNFIGALLIGFGGYFYPGPIIKIISFAICILLLFSVYGLLFGINLARLVVLVLCILGVISAFFSLFIGMGDGSAEIENILIHSLAVFFNGAIFFYLCNKGVMDEFKKN